MNNIIKYKFAVDYKKNITLFFKNINIYVNTKNDQMLTDGCWPSLIL